MIGMSFREIAEKNWLLIHFLSHIRKSFINGLHSALPQYAGSVPRMSYHVRPG